MQHQEANVPSKIVHFASLLILGIFLPLSASAQEIVSEDATITLAEVELAAEHTAQFIGFPERGEVAYIELGKGGEARPFFHQFEDLSTLKKYLILAPETAPLPRMLVESETEMKDFSDGKPFLGGDSSLEERNDLERLIAERGVVESVPGLITADLGSDALKERFARHAQAVPELGPDLKASGDWDTGSWNCANGSATFANSFCNGSGGSGKIHFCDAGTFTGQRIRNSYNGGWYKRKYSFGITAACNDLVDVVHNWWNGTSWKTTLHVTSLPSGYWMWTRYQGNGKYYRRVLHRTVYHTGYHRSYTAFYN